MAWLLMGGMLCLLLRADVTMDAASAACRLFVTAVLPGLLPYMVLSLMLTSRLKRLSPALVMALGWGGGSPTGARLLGMCPGLSPGERVRVMIACATMSPMFLLGTVGGWLGSGLAGTVVLVSVIAGGWLAGWMCSCFHRGDHGSSAASTSENAGGASPAPTTALSFGAAVESASRTMLLVCGTMVMLRVFAALAAEVLPDVLILPVTTALEVTTGTATIAGLPLPLPWRTALIAGAAGFGGLSILLQNRAVAGEGAMPLGRQMVWQGVHGGISFGLALGLMWMVC